MSGNAAVCAWIALALALCACAPTTLYDCSFPRGDRSVAVVAEREGQYVVTLGKRYGPYDEVALETLLPSPNGKRIAWAASAEGTWRVYVDGAPSAAWEGVGELAWTPASTSVVFAARRDGSWHVVSPRGVGPGHRDVVAGSICACDGAAAYIATDDRGALVVVGDHSLGPFAAAGGLAVDKDCRGFVFASGSAQGAFVHIGQRRHGPFLDVAEIAFAPSSGRTAASVLTPDGWQVLADGSLSEPLDAIGSLVFSRNGGRFACAVRKLSPSNHPWFVLTDDQSFGPFEKVEHHSLAFSHDEASLAWVATVEGRARVFLEGEPLLGDFDEVRCLHFAERSSVLGFVGVSGRGAEVYVGGALRGHYEDVVDLALSRDGSRFVAAAAIADRTMVVVDEVPHAYDPIPGTLTFDATGRRWGAIASDGSAFSLFFVLNGVRGPSLELVELSDLARNRDLQTPERLEAALRQWVRSELGAVAAPTPPQPATP